MKVLIEHKDGKSGRDRTFVTIEKGDLWEGDVTLAKVIYPFLKKYRDLYNGKNPTCPSKPCLRALALATAGRSRMCGYPAAFAPDPCKPECTENPDRFNEWLLCLDKMIYSFEWIAKKRDWDGPEVKNYLKEYTLLLKPYRKELKKLAQEDKKRFAAFKPYGALNSLEWDRRSEITHPIFKKYHKKFEAHQAKVQEGINLFAEHFGSLWT
jgi:hypothetical protein